jgi:hypothetical protein
MAISIPLRRNELPTPVADAIDRLENFRAKAREATIRLRELSGPALAAAQHADREAHADALIAGRKPTGINHEAKLHEQITAAKAEADAYNLAMTRVEADAARVFHEHRNSIRAAAITGISASRTEAVEHLDALERAVQEHAELRSLQEWEAEGFHRAGKIVVPNGIREGIRAIRDELNRMSA